MNAPRNQPIRKITPHMVAGVTTGEQLFNTLRNRGISANYGIASNGEIWLYANESDRAWTSSSGANDHQAITIEVGNSGMGPQWPVSDLVLRRLHDLCECICRRNNIPLLVYDGTANGTLTRHNMFAATSCPGPFLQSRFPQIAHEVNRRLGVAQAPGSPALEDVPTVNSPGNGVLEDGRTFAVGNHVILNGPAFNDSFGNRPVPSLTNRRGVISRVMDLSRVAPIHIEGLGWVRVTDIIAEQPTAPSFQSYLVRVTASVLNIRSGPGTDHAIVGTITDRGTYTIVEESQGQGSRVGWGRLKSGAGWIALCLTERR